MKLRPDSDGAVNTHYNYAPALLEDVKPEGALGDCERECVRDLLRRVLVHHHSAVLQLQPHAGWQGHQRHADRRLGEVAEAPRGEFQGIQGGPILINGKINE